MPVDGSSLAGSSTVGAAGSSPPPMVWALLDTREVKATTEPGIRDTQMTAFCRQAVPVC